MVETNSASGPDVLSCCGGPGCNSPAAFSCEAPGDSESLTVGRRGSGPSYPGLNQNCG